MNADATGAIAPLLAAVRRHLAGAETAEDARVLAAAGCARLGGGFNNAVFRLDPGDGPLCVKAYRVDERRRWRREWTGLTLLAKRLPGFAPRPIALDDGGEPPIVVMERVPGERLGGRPLDDSMVAALAAGLDAMHRLVPDATTAHVEPAVGTAESILARVAAWVASPPPRPLEVTANEARGLAAEWLASPGPTLLTESAPLVFTRGDPYLNNCLWHAGRMRFVDFEYCGWRDRAFDLADYMEHIEARSIPDDRWLELVDRFRLDPAERRRFHAGRQLVALFFTMLLDTRRADPDVEPPRLPGQVERARRLCGTEAG